MHCANVKILGSWLTTTVINTLIHAMLHIQQRQRHWVETHEPTKKTLFAIIIFNNNLQCSNQIVQPVILMHVHWKKIRLPKK